MSLLRPIARSLLESAGARRKILSCVLVFNLSLMGAASTWWEAFLAERPVLYILCWLLVALLTLFMGLLAVFDLLKLRGAAKHAAQSEVFNDEHHPDTH